MKLYPTKTANLFYHVHAKTQEKTYYARFRKDKREIKRKLSTSLRQSKLLLKQLLEADTVEKIDRKLNDINTIIENKLGNTKYSLNTMFKEYMNMTSSTQSHQEIRTKLSLCVYSYVIACKYYYYHQCYIQ